MTQTTATAATAAPRLSLATAPRAARARDTAKAEGTQPQPSHRTTDEPAVMAEAPPRWPRVFPGL